MGKYVHGYSQREAVRLNDQADTLEELLHHDSVFSSGNLILEAGCGVGAQTQIIAPKNPECRFISIDISKESLQEAKSIALQNNILNVEFQQADIFHLPYPDEYFNDVFICFVLEHIPDPHNALLEVKRVLKKNGTLTVIEGDHGSTFMHPHSDEAHLAIDCQVELQKRAGGNANIGRELYPLIKNAGFNEVHVSPRMVYADSSKPDMVEGFTRNTFTAMIEGVEKPAIENKLLDAVTFRKGIDGLYRSSEEDGVFCYTFFKAKAVKGRD